LSIAAQPQATKCNSASSCHRTVFQRVTAALTVSSSIPAHFASQREAN
jgi:hypothetical protein